MIKLTQISMRKVEQLQPSCTAGRAWFVDYL